MSDKTAKTWRFQATIQPAEGGGAFVYFPFDTMVEFGTKSKIPIKAIIAGVPDSGYLIPYGQPQHMLHVPKSIRQQTGQNIGATIEVELWKDDSQRTLEVPEHLDELFKQQGVYEFFSSLSYTNRKEYIRWLTEAKTESTKQKRLTKSIGMLKANVKTPG